MDLLHDILLAVFAAISFMPLAFMWCCCEECNVALDDFNRAALGTDWNQIAGTWSISGSVALSTTDSDGLIIHDSPTGEIQHFVFGTAAAPIAPVAGTYTLTFDGQTTAALNWDDDETVVQAALEALSNIGAGNVAVVSDGDNGFTVEFIGDKGGQDLPEITASSSLKQAAATVTVTETQAGEFGVSTQIFTVELDDSPTEGKFILSETNIHFTDTAAVAEDASSATLEAAIDAIEDYDVTGSAGGIWTCESVAQDAFGWTGAEDPSNPLRKALGIEVETTREGSGTGAGFGDDRSQVLESKFWADTADDVAWFILGYDDVAPNYVAAAVKFLAGDCGELRFYSDNIGTTSGEVYYFSGLSLSTYHTIRFCLDFTTGELTANVTTADDTYQFKEIVTLPSPSGDQAGYGTGTITGTIKFDDFAFYLHKLERTSCPDCELDAECLLYSDTFDRSNNDAAGCLWEEVSGDWDISSNVITTSNSNGILKNRTRHPENTTNAVLTVLFQTIASGEAVRAIIGYEDTDNYLFVEIITSDTGCGEIRLRQRASGSDSNLADFDAIIPDSLLPSGAWHTLRLCHSESENKLHAIVTASGGTEHGHWGTIDLTFGGTTPYVALGTGTVGAAVEFNNFSYYRGNDAIIDCDECYSGTCTIFTDAFSNSDIDCVWSQESGTWSEGAAFITTTDTDAFLLCLAGHPGRTIDGDRVDLTQGVAADFKCSAYSDQFRVIVDYVDADNYHFAEVTMPTGAGAPDSATLKTFKRSGGTNTQLDSTTISGLLLDTVYSLRVCYDQVKIQAGCGSAAVEQDSVGHGGKRAAIGSGTLTGTLSVDTFNYVHDLYAECLSCPSIVCAACESGFVPYLAKLVINVADDGCSDCDLFDGTYFIPYTACQDGIPVCAPESADFSTGVTYEQSAFTVRCGQNVAMGVSLNRETGTDNWYLYARVNAAFAIGATTYEIYHYYRALVAVSEDPPDCAAIPDTVLTYQGYCWDNEPADEETEESARTQCDWPNATITAGLVE